MAKFLNTSATNYFLEELIKDAKDRLILISPYLKFNDRIKELLGHYSVAGGLTGMGSRRGNSTKRRVRNRRNDAAVPTDDKFIESVCRT
ncbi:hypothetical protein [Lysobacter sp. A289]